MDIYDINEDLVKTLVKFGKIQIFSKEFNDIRENYGKVNYVEKLLVQFQQLQKLDLKLELRTQKNEEKSVAYRKEGNEHFSLKKKEYFKAFTMYNKSICFAENDSENIGIGYANRSAILFEWKRYKECLENIKLARNAKYPERLLHKLDKRENDCKTFIAEQENDIEPYPFQINFNKHPVVPYIADCLDMNETKEMGRYIYTKTDLKPGDLVSIEESFCSVLLPPMRYIRCANCKQENYLTLIPCPNCTSAMFCSEKCQSEAYETFHKYECPLIDMLYTLFNKIHLTALRVSLIAFGLFENIEEFMEFCSDSRNQGQNSFSLDYTNFTRKEHYKAIHGLVTNQKKRSTADLFQRAVVAAVLKRYLIHNSPLKNCLNGEDGENLFTDLLFRHLQVSPSNFHSVDLIEQKNETKDDQCFASAAYAFGSLLNHSCAPNTVRIYKGTTTYLFVLRPILKDGLLYDNYGYHYATQPKKLRLRNLDMQYRFVCTCQACHDDYPLYHSLPVPPTVPEEIQSDDVHLLMAYDRQFALDNYQRYCDFLLKYSEHYPCAQISSAEESLKMALNILVDAVPLKAKV